MSENNSSIAKIARELETTVNVELLSKHSTHESKRVRLAVLSNPAVPDKTIREMIQADNSYCFLYAASIHPNLSAETADIILDNNGLTPKVKLEDKEIPALSIPDIHSSRSRKASSVAHKLLQQPEINNKPLPPKPLNPVMLERLFRRALEEDVEMRKFTFSMLSSRDDLPAQLVLDLAGVLADSKYSEETFNASYYFFSKADRSLEATNIVADGDSIHSIHNVIRHSKHYTAVKRAYERAFVVGEGDDSYGLRSPNFSVVENANIPVEFVLEAYNAGFEKESENTGSRMSNRFERVLSDNLLSNRRGEKFLESHNVSVEGLPDDYIIKLVKVKASDLGLLSSKFI